jgi:hypothetical protein
MIRNGYHAFNKPPRWAQIDRAHPLAQGLQAAWLFTEGTGNTLFDSSGNGNHLVGMNSPTWGAGQKGIAGQTNGTTQYWDNATMFLPTTASTVILIATPGPSVNTGSIIGNSQSDPTGTNKDFNIHYPYSGTIYWDFAGTGNPGRVSYTPTGSFFGKSHHMAFVVGTGVQAIYEDSALKVSAASGGVRANLNPGVQIGRRGSLYQQATIEQFLIYNRVLSAAEIAWLYEENYAFMTPPTVRRFYSLPSGVVVPGSYQGGLAISPQMQIGI